ncbi:MAG: hypothetical protein JWO88_2058 [Frankiales bacterium]|nr:hypothetical protein [Frankiales bacterium]
MRVRLAAASAGVILAAGAGVASAAAPPVPVHVWIQDGSVCFVVSQQVPHCLPIKVLEGRPAVAGQRTGLATPVPPISLPYKSGDRICYDPTPTSKGPCIPIPQP